MPPSANLFPRKFRGNFLSFPWFLWRTQKWVPHSFGVHCAFFQAAFFSFPGTPSKSFPRRKTALMVLTGRAAAGPVAVAAVTFTAVKPGEGAPCRTQRPGPAGPGACFLCACRSSPPGTPGRLLGRPGPAPADPLRLVRQVAMPGPVNKAGEQIGGSPRCTGGAPRGLPLAACRNRSESGQPDRKRRSAPCRYKVIRG